MKQKAFYLLLAAEAAACVALALCRNLLPGFFSILIAFPLEQIGYGLRQLSLSGSTGNVLAIVLYVLLSLLPLVFLLRRKLHGEDTLLGVMSAALFFSLYCMVNPGLLSQWVDSLLGEPFEKAILGMFFYSLLVSYGILRLLRSFFAAERQRLHKYLHILLGGVSVLLVYLVFASGFSGLLDSFAALREGNVGNEHLLGWTYVFLSLQYAVNALPYLFDLVIVYALGVLLRAERYSEEAELAAKKLSRLCGLSLVAVIVSNLAYQLLQLLFMKHLTQLNSTVEIPLLSLLAILAVLLLAQVLGENRQLKSDNDLFI